MLESEFYQWLLSKGYNESTSRARKSNCITVGLYEGDLDNHFETDRCKDLLNRLGYSTDDQIHNRKAKHKVPIKGNIRTGSATLKQAVKLYVQYRSENILGRTCVNDNISVGHKKRISNRKEWPKWEQPSENEIYELAQTATKYIRFLDPQIIYSITQDNEKNHSYFSELLLRNGVDTNLYLWKGSPCCFPGIRRYAGSKEISFYRKQSDLDKTSITNALRLDDNDFPKQIWSYILRGAAFSKFGPDNYSLAHLIDHKESKNRMATEFEFLNNQIFTDPFYGLYTCPSNTVYIPTSLLKPTDFNTSLRNLLFNKANSLYGDFCNIIPDHIKIPCANDRKWDICNFTWSDPVGSIQHIGLFLEYRNRTITDLSHKGL